MKELNWNMQKMFLVFYYTKFGIKNLPFETVAEFASFLRTTEKGLKMWESNFRFLMGKKKRTLEHFSKEQSYIFCKYANMDSDDMEDKALEYIEKR